MPNTQSRYPKWWLRKTREEQEAYLQVHKNSKLKITRRKAKPSTGISDVIGPTPSVNEQRAEAHLSAALKSSPIVEKLSTATSAFLSKNAKKVEESINDAIDTAASKVEEKISSMPSKVKAQVGSLIKKAVASESTEQAMRTTAVTLAKLGILTIGIAAGVTAGIPLALSLLVLYDQKHKVSAALDQPLNTMIGSYVNNVFDGIRSGAKDQKLVRKSVTTEEPDVSPDDDKARSEKASVVSSNITEQIKHFITLSKYDWKSELASISPGGVQWVRARNTLNLLYRIEKAAADLRILHSRFMSQGESGYAQRASAELARVESVRSMAVAYVDSSTKTMREDWSRRETAKAIRQRIAPKATLTHTLIMHSDKLTPVYRVEDTGRTLYIGTEDASVLLGVSTDDTTPCILDRVEMKSRSLSSILKEFELL